MFVLPPDPKVLCLGLIQSLFEGAMYCFVLEWTPSLSIVYKNDSATGSLKEEHTDIPHGHIFAAFMVSYGFKLSLIVVEFFFSILLIVDWYVK